MIELQKDAEFVPLVADLVATLMTRDEMESDEDKLFTLNIWTRAVMYLFYDVIEYIRVDKE